MRFTQRLKQGLWLALGGLVLAAGAGYIVFRQLSDGFNGSGLFYTAHLGFNGELLLFALPFVGAGVMLTGIVFCVIGLVEGRRQRI